MKEQARENWAAALRSGAIMAALIISVSGATAIYEFDFVCGGRPDLRRQSEAANEVFT